MPTSHVSNLWPSAAINVDARTPISIFREQAALLRQMTNGVLEAEVSSVVSAKGVVEHNFDVIAPLMGGYRRRLFVANNNQEQVYPVTIHITDYQYEEADSEKALREKLATVLSSPKIVSALQSIIAKSNDGLSSVYSLDVLPGQLIRVSASSLPAGESVNFQVMDKYQYQKMNESQIGGIPHWMPDGQTHILTPKQLTFDYAVPNAGEWYVLINGFQVSKYEIVLNVLDEEVLA